MGLMKQSKINTIGQDAARAKGEGRTVFVCRYWDEVLNFQGTGAISGASEAIEAVEAAGWALDDFSYSWAPEKKRGISVMVFRPNPNAAVPEPERFASVDKEKLGSLSD